MRRLHHAPLSPFGRAVRLALTETGRDAELTELSFHPAEARAELATLGLSVLLETAAPAAAPFDAPMAPILVADHIALSGSRAILEYLEEAEEGGLLRLIPEDAESRAEMRRIQEFAETVFWREAVEPRLIERLLKRQFLAGAPDADRLRIAGQAARRRFAALGRLLEHRRWLAGESLSLADFAMAAQVSVLDYFGDRPWGGAEEDGAAAAREWYALVKSRPAFRRLLADRHPALPPSPGYGELDF